MLAEQSDLASKASILERWRSSAKTRMCFPGRNGSIVLGLANDLVYHQRMTEVGVHEAKSTLSRLLRRVAMGEEIVITRGREPVAKLVPIGDPVTRRLGGDRDVLRVPDDFDAPLPQDIIAEFEK